MGEPFITYTDGSMYPPSYGIFCDAHDIDLVGDGCADAEGMPLADAPAFCAQEWCYVSNDCELADTAVANLNPDVSYSYMNCGGEDTFSADNNVAAADDTMEDEGSSLIDDALALF